MARVSYVTTITGVNSARQLLLLEKTDSLLTRLLALEVTTAGNTTNQQLDIGIGYYGTGGTFDTAVDPTSFELGLTAPGLDVKKTASVDAGGTYTPIWRKAVPSLTGWRFDPAKGLILSTTSPTQLVVSLFAPATPASMDVVISALIEHAWE